MRYKCKDVILLPLAAKKQLGELDKQAVLSWPPPFPPFFVIVFGNTYKHAVVF